MLDDDDLPSYAELMAVLDKIAPHAEKLPPPLAIELLKVLARFPSDEVNDAPHTP